MKERGRGEKVCKGESNRNKEAVGTQLAPELKRKATSYLQVLSTTSTTIALFFNISLPLRLSSRKGNLQTHTLFTQCELYQW